MESEKVNNYHKRQQRFKSSLEDNQQLKHAFPFSVPKDYFENLPNQIVDRINLATKPSLISLFTNRISQPAWTISSLIILIVVVLTSIWVYNTNNNFYHQDQELTLEEVLEEFPYFYDDIDESEIITFLMAENDEAFMDFYFENIHIESVHEDDIIEYLFNENIDNELILDF